MGSRHAGQGGKGQVHWAAWWAQGWLASVLPGCPACALCLEDVHTVHFRVLRPPAHPPARASCPTQSPHPPCS